MSHNRKDLRKEFKEVQPLLQKISDKLERFLSELFSEVHHIDRIGSRIKAEESYLNKAMKKVEEKEKYEIPLKEIQDLIGARIVIYYKTDVDAVADLIKKHFDFVEENRFVPDDVSKFGYEGVHYICMIPNTIYSDHKANLLVPEFFELQIKTLYQHAWSQAEHGLGYKPGAKLSFDEERKLAFIAAQSWGADSILDELARKK